MTSHGTSRHSRYERLLRKHRLETREDRQESILDAGRVGREQETPSRDLHDRGVDLHQKRQYQPNQSTTEAQPVTQTNLTGGAEPIATTTTHIPEETASASERSIVSSDSDQQATELHTTTTSDDASTTVTAVTTITTTVSYPSDPATESGVDLTTSISDHTAVAATVEDASDERSMTESAPSETSTMETESSESATGSSTELASTDTSTVPLSDAEEHATSTAELDTVDTSTVPLNEPTESVTAVASMSVALSEAVTEVSGIIASLTSDIESLSASTQHVLPISASATSPTTSVTVSTSVPIISQSSGPSNDTPMFSGSSPDIPTAVVSTQTPSSTSTEGFMGAGSDDGSTSSSEINTGSTNTSITSNSTSSITSATTASESSASNSGSSSQGGYGWGGGSSSDPTGTSDGSTVSSDTGSSSLSPQTTGKIVGGVVGGVAGASLLFLLLWFLLRRRRKTGFFLSSPASRSIADDGGVGGGLIGAPARSEMASRGSNKDSIFGSAAYFAPAFMKRWRQSQISTGEESFVSTTPSSERGFQKISGRKLPSGAQPGFDDGNGSLSPTDSELSATLPPIIPRSAFSPSQPPPSNPFSMPLDTSYTREAPEEGVPVMRPSPARIPTSGSANAATSGEASVRSVPMPFPMPPSGPIAIPKRPDALGRSHPSFDGSRGSRFTESL
ncbi:hypothetical protein BDV11DRAFT_114746 [Aspergillus similis]